jgi:hypothetical protein
MVSMFLEHVMKNKAQALWFKAVAENSLAKWGTAATTGRANRAAGRTNQDTVWGQGTFYSLDARYFHDKEWKSVKDLDNKVPKADLEAAKVIVDWGTYGSLAKALGAVVGSYYRRDHLTVLEQGLNAVKMGIFKANANIHGPQKLANLAFRECVKNPALLDESNDPDPTTVLKDRVNLMFKQVSAHYRSLISCYYAMKECI